MTWENKVYWQEQLQREWENELNARRVTTISETEVRYQTDDDFESGTVGDDTEVAGSGTDGYVRLKNLGENDDDIPYTTEGNYTLSDGAKLEVTGGDAKLKAIGGLTDDWTFATPGNYTYGADIEVSGGEARLVDGTPSDSEYFADYSSDSNANWGSGTLTATENGSPSVSGGYLDLTSATASSVAYQGAEIAGGQTGCIRIVYQPNYSGSPASNLYLWRMKPNSGSGEIYCRHDNSGDIRVIIKDNTGTTKVTLITGAGSFNPTANQDYEIEVNWDLTTGATRVFLDGTQLGSTNTSTGTLNSGTQQIYIGSYFPTSASGADSKIGGFIVYDAVQHTANYTAGYLAGIPSTKYPMTDPTIVADNGFVFTGALNSFMETSTKTGSDEIKYHVSDDDGSTWYYWNGASWAVTDDSYAQANTATDINANISSLAGSGTFTFRALLHSADGSTTPELDNIYAAESQTYSTDDDLYIDTKDAVQIDPSNIIEYLTTTISNSLPANTDARVMFSVDGRSNWLTWGGSEWEAPTSATDRSYATTISDAQTNFADLPIGNGTLDVRLFLYTSSSSVSPTISNINVTSGKGISTSGEYYSKTYDTEEPYEDQYIKIAFDVDVPDGTTVQIQTRTSEDSSTWSDFSDSYTNGEEIVQTGRYIQWRAILTGDGVLTPKVERVSIFYIIGSLYRVSP